MFWVSHLLSATFDVSAQEELEAFAGFHAAVQRLMILEGAFISDEAS